MQNRIATTRQRLRSVLTRLQASLATDDPVRLMLEGEVSADLDELTAIEEKLNDGTRDVSFPARNPMGRSTVR